MQMNRRFSLLLAALLVFTGGGLLFTAAVTAQDKSAQDESAQDSQEKKVLTIDDYGKWNRIRTAVLSPDGMWFASIVAPNEGDSTLYLENLADADTKFEIKSGVSPQF